jgi:hypothetical protein
MYVRMYVTFPGWLSSRKGNIRNVRNLRRTFPRIHVGFTIKIIDIEPSLPDQAPNSTFEWPTARL